MEGLGAALEGLRNGLEGLSHSSAEDLDGSIETLCVIGLEALAGGQPSGSGGCEDFGTDAPIDGCVGTDCRIGLEPMAG